MTEQKNKISWWKKLLHQYNQLCRDLGVDKGNIGCCMPRVEMNENGSLKKDKPLIKNNVKPITILIFAL